MANKVYEHEGALIAYGKRLDEIEHQISRIEKDKLIMEQGMTSFEKDIAELKEIVGHYHRDVEGEKWPKLGTKLGEKVANLEAKVAMLQGNQPEKSSPDEVTDAQRKEWWLGHACDIDPGAPSWVYEYDPELGDFASKGKVRCFFFSGNDVGFEIDGRKYISHIMKPVLVKPEKSWADKSVTTRDVLWMCGTALVGIGVFILWGILT